MLGGFLGLLDTALSCLALPLGVATEFLVTSLDLGREGGCWVGTFSLIWRCPSVREGYCGARTAGQTQAEQYPGGR